MNVQPDFLDHWKRKKLARMLHALPITGEADGDFYSIVTLLRLWGHCQTQRTWIFPRMSAEILAAVCHWPYGSDDLVRALLECGFITVSKGGRTITVHKWQVHNRSLVTYWERGEYGKLGGRPRKQTSKVALENPGETSKVSSENPGQTLNNNNNNNNNNTSSPCSPPPSEGGDARQPRKAKAAIVSLPEFEQFWKKYPRPVGKRAALAKWRELKPDLARCLAALRRQRQSEQWQREGGRFIPNPATWLHQGRWEDGAEPDSQKITAANFGIEPEVPGWRNLMLEANPELNLPKFWGELSATGRAWARELYNSKSAV